MAFELVNGKNEVVAEQDIHGEVLLMTFGFTRCTGTCPVVLRRLRESLELLPEDSAAQVRVVFIGVDYRYDSPEQVAHFAEAHGPRFMGLTGSSDDLQQLYRRMGVSARHVESSDGPVFMHHATGIYLVDAKGRPRYLVEADASTATLANTVQRLLTGA